MGFRGGGTAGGGKSSRNAPRFVRHVPRFLQKYEHLMGKRHGDVEYEEMEDGSTSVPNEDLLAKRKVEDLGDIDDEIEGATVVHELKEIIAQSKKKHKHSDELESIPLTEEEAEIEAVNEKENGNAAYSESRFQDAIDAFTRALVVAKKDQHILYSNRSAAFAAIGNWTNALIDARKAIELRPRWGKAYSRLGAALHGLKRYEEAEAAYSRGLTEEPKNAALIEGLDLTKRSRIKLESIEASGRHLFRKSSTENNQSVAVGRRRGVLKQGASDSSKKGKKNLLSFDETDE